MNLEVKDTREGLVPDSTFFCLDVDRDIMVGAVNIRHYLNESLLLNVGHIGHGVCPSEQRKGIASAMIGLALVECKKLGINRVLMVCDKDNIGSMKSIQNNGGVSCKNSSATAIKYAIINLRKGKKSGKGRLPKWIKYQSGFLTMGKYVPCGTI